MTCIIPNIKSGINYNCSDHMKTAPVTADTCRIFIINLDLSPEIASCSENTWLNHVKGKRYIKRL